MENSKPTVLIVDDEIFNLEILAEHLGEAGYDPVTAENGAIAWKLLEESPTRFSAVLLDRMMPEMDGMEVLDRIKSHPSMKMLPVIMQTAKAARSDVLEGLQAGAYYYLTKPFDREHLIAIMATAVNDYQRYILLQEEAEQTATTLNLMNKGMFSFRTLEEGRNLVTLLASACPEAEKVVLGLSELIVNAVEHGNLGITYEEKTELNKQDTWETEVNHRQSLTENADKQVAVEFERTAKGVEFLIRDQGEGFDWQEFMELSPDRVFDSHGRGIAMANAVSFDQIEYRGKGNEVMALVAGT